VRQKEDQLITAASHIAARDAEFARLSRESVPRHELDAVREAVARAERDVAARDKQIRYLSDKLERVRGIYLSLSVSEADLH
jgi:hypothetical protein